MSSPVLERIKGLTMRRAVVTVNLESTSLRLVASRGRTVLSWLNLPLNPQLFANDQIGNEEDMGAVLRSAARRLRVRPTAVLAAFSGSRSLSRVLTLPSAREINPAVIIPREARRLMGPTVDQSYLHWHPLAPVRDQPRYQVLAIPRGSMDSMVRALILGGLRPTVVELKPMALARCIPETSGVIVDLESGAIDIIVVVDALPVATYIAPLEEDAPQDERQMAARLAEDVRRGLEAFADRNPGQSTGAAMPVFLTGGHPFVGASLIERLETDEGLTVTLAEASVKHPPGFPRHPFMVNLGLLLRSRHR